MEILPTVRAWLSSASSQPYDSVSQQTPDALLEKARKGSFPSVEPDKSVMAPIPSKEYIPPTPVRPFSEEISAAVREQYPEIPWKTISALRHVLVHGYFLVDLDIVWGIVQRDLPVLKAKLERILEELQ